MIEPWRIHILGQMNASQPLNRNDGGLRIALVDPDEGVLLALQRRLMEQRTVSEVSVHPLRSLDPGAIDRFDPHVVVIDPRSYGMSAPDILSSILSLPLRAERFIVAAHVTVPGVGEEAEALAAGCELYLLKGLQTADLIERLTAAIRRRLPRSRWPAALAV